MEIPICLNQGKNRFGYCNNVKTLNIMFNKEFYYTPVLRNTIPILDIVRHHIPWLFSRNIYIDEDKHFAFQSRIEPAIWKRNTSIHSKVYMTNYTISFDVYDELSHWTEKKYYSSGSLTKKSIWFTSVFPCSISFAFIFNNSQDKSFELVRKLFSCWGKLNFRFAVCLKKQYMRSTHEHEKIHFIFIRKVVPS